MTSLSTLGAFKLSLALSRCCHAPRASPKWPVPQAGHFVLTRVSPWNDIKSIRTNRGQIGVDPGKLIDCTNWRGRKSEDVYDFKRRDKRETLAQFFCQDNLKAKGRILTNEKSVKNVANSRWPLAVHNFGQAIWRHFSLKLSYLHLGL